jgi:formamidopyrimidine-DNA glycosylase
VRDVSPDDPYVRAVFDLDDGSRLAFVDVRTLGEMEVVSAREWERRAADMGPEPLEPSFTPEVLAARLAESRRAVKEFLLDQTRVAGIGNIYAVEALWRARVSPRRRARNLGPVRARRLHRAIVEVLTEAVGKAGTTLGETALDYVDSEGAPGEFAESLAVYDREGEPCFRCGTLIRRIVQGQRSTYYCPTCQR